MEGLAYPLKKISTLYSNQDRRNIEVYKERYCMLLKLLGELHENLEDWQIKLKESKNDRVYHLYTAAVQTALYSVYSRPWKYVEFLKLTGRQEAECPGVQKGRLQDFEDISKDWEIKADVMLRQAHYHINRALTLDRYNFDALILRAQLYALEGKFEDASKIFEVLEKEQVFTERLALLNSWKAFFELNKKMSTDKGEKFLRESNAYHNPPVFQMGIYLS